MNRTQFFATVKLARCPVVVTQDDDKGYKLSARVQHEGEEAQEFSLLYKTEPRYFKSLAGVETVLKDNGVYSFTVNMNKSDITKRTRAKRTAAATAAPAAKTTKK